MVTVSCGNGREKIAKDLSPQVIKKNPSPDKKEKRPLPVQLPYYQNDLKTAPNGGQYTYLQLSFYEQPLSENNANLVGSMMERKGGNVVFAKDNPPPPDYTLAVPKWTPKKALKETGGVFGNVDRMSSHKQERLLEVVRGLTPATKELIDGPITVIETGEKDFKKLAKEGIKGLKGGVIGRYYYNDNLLLFRDNLSPSRATQTIAHEVGHEVWDNLSLAEQLHWYYTYNVNSPEWRDLKSDDGLIKDTFIPKETMKTGNYYSSYAPNTEEPFAEIFSQTIMRNEAGAKDVINEKQRNSEALYHKVDWMDDLFELPESDSTTTRLAMPEPPDFLDKASSYINKLKQSIELPSHGKTMSAHEAEGTYEVSGQDLRSDHLCLKTDAFFLSQNLITYQIKEDSDCGVLDYVVAQRGDGKPFYIFKADRDQEDIVFDHIDSFTNEKTTWIIRWVELPKVVKQKPIELIRDFSSFPVSEDFLPRLIDHVGVKGQIYANVIKTEQTTPSKF